MTVIEMRRNVKTFAKGLIIISFLLLQADLVAVFAQPTDNAQMKQLLLQAGAILKESRNASKELTGFVQLSQLQEFAGKRPLCRLPCKNGGECVKTDTCLCVNEWFGVDCSQFVCDVACRHGRCTAPNTCFCDVGWKGSDCASPICNPECLNGGICDQPNHCTCPSGFNGTNCQTALCNPPCQNGICTTSNQCLCLSGWTGPSCDTAVCIPSCQHSGICAKPFTCQCVGSWGGHSCETPVCRKGCQNGGECIAPDTCSCSPGYEGPQCQFAALSSTTSGSICLLWSGKHFRTFDGITFDFPGRCRYTMATNCDDRSFTVELIKDPQDLIPSHPIKNRTAANMIHAKLQRMLNASREFIALSLTIRGSDSLILLPDRVAILGNRILDNVAISTRTVSLNHVGQYLQVSTKLGINIMWNGDGLAKIEVDKELLGGSLCGLCGNADGSSSNDMMMPDNTIASNIVWFARGWRVVNINEQCEEVTSETSSCAGLSADHVHTFRRFCEIFITNNDAFSECVSAGVDPTPIVDSCVSDLCLCENEFRSDCQCRSVAQYARLCMMQTDIVPDWRKPNFCAVQCSDTMIYSECGSSCPKTCQSLITQESSCRKQCVDGCTCPPGTLLHGRTCVPKNECPCVHNGMEYPSGHILSQECSTCTCNSAMWNCTDRQCVSECSAVGDPHYKTFDDLKYTMHGECQYTFVKDCSSTNLFTIAVDNSVCGSDSTITCTKDVTVTLQISTNTGSGSGSNTTRHGLVIVRFSQGHVASVDGKVIVPPFIRQKFQIFRLSSTFIELQTDIGITLDWDGKSRVYVKAEGRWKGKLCGLCGNYNGNQKDDMRNFNGMVERNPVSFGNSWKANSDCLDAPLLQPVEPCQVNQQRSAFAETECAFLLGETFSECHHDVDPTSYYEMCLYDVCECEDGQLCLCNVIAHYARVCSRAGHVTEWRAENFCYEPCSGGQVFRECASSCHSTCRSISDQSVRCEGSCVQGCNCPEGLFLDADGSCVEKTQCQCYHNGRIYRAFETMHREFTTCHCMGGRFTCVNINEKLGILSDSLRSYRSTVCPSGQIYKICNSSEANSVGIECQETCRNLGEECFASACVEGCGCPPGQVYDPERTVCIQSHDCPCYYSGLAYLPGHTLNVECNTCECINREWVCTDNPCIGTCTVYGEAHHMTFDSYTYDFLGSCSYVLAQDFCNNQQGTFRIHIENKRCSTDAASCTKAVTIVLEDKLAILLEQEPFGYETKRIVSWGPAPGSETNLTRILWDYHEVGIYVIVTTDAGLTVTWDKKTSVIVKLDPKFKGEVCGLCGNFDGNQNNDAIKSDHIQAVTSWEFGNSWKTSSNCEDATAWENACTLYPHRKPWAQKSCRILYSSVFEPCHSMVDVTWYHHNCIFDACVCDSGGDCDCFCTAIAAYARACAEAGTPVKWRTPQICPLMCESYNNIESDCTWHYSECNSPCPNTCQHRYLINNSSECALPFQCVEGCFPNCPEGMFYDNELRECVVECMVGCNANGKVYSSGEIVKEEPCVICTCLEGGSLGCFTPSECVPTEVTVFPFLTTAGTEPEPGMSDTSPFTTTPFEHVLDITGVRRFCEGEVNLIFLVHSAESLTPHEFQDVKRIIFTYVSAIAPEDYGKNTSNFHVGIKQFGDEIENDLMLNGKQDMSILADTIQNMELQRSKQTHLSQALLSASRLFNDSETSAGDNVLFVFLFSKPTDHIADVLRQLEGRNIKTIMLTIWDDEDHELLHHHHGSHSQQYHLENVGDIFSPSTTVSMNILEQLCEGENKPQMTTISPITTVPVSTTASPTTIEPTGEQCTMKADLVILMDLGLLHADDERIARGKQDSVFAFLQKLLKNVTISESRTRVAMLLVDNRSWRVTGFSFAKDDLLSSLEDDIMHVLTTKPRTSSLNNFDLQYALDEAVVDYLLSPDGDARANDFTVHQSILVLQGRQPLESLQPSLQKTLVNLKDKNIMLTIVANPGTYSNRVDKTTWQRMVGIDNIVFSSLSNGGALDNTNEIIKKICRTPSVLPAPSAYCDQATDIYYLWDETHRISIIDLMNMAEATRKISNTLNPLNFHPEIDGMHRVRISVIQFSDTFDYFITLEDNNLLHEFLDSFSPSISSWNTGRESDLDIVLQEISDAFDALIYPRNVTIVLFTASSPKKSWHSERSVVEELREKGINIISVGFGNEISRDELRNISGIEGFYLSLATSREILDNDIGNAISEKLCSQGIMPTGTIYSTPVVTSQPGTHYTTKPFQLTANVTVVPSCMRPIDVHILIDSLLASDRTRKGEVADILYHTFSDFEIDDGSRYSRVSLAVVGSSIDTKIRFSDEGSDKARLLQRFSQRENNSVITEVKSNVPFNLERSLTSGEHLFFEPNLREVAGYSQTFLLILSRLPPAANTQTSSKDGVLERIKELQKRGYGFLLVYYSTAFLGVPIARRNAWLRTFEGSSLLIDSDHSPSAQGREVADMLCYITVPTPSLPASTFSYTPSAVTTSGTEIDTFFCYGQPIDVIFMLESSISIGTSPSNFAYMKKFLTDVISPFHLSQDAVRVAVVQFGIRENAKEPYGFLMRDHNSRASLLEAVENLEELQDQPYKPGLSPALDIVTNYLFTRSPGEAQRVVIIVSSTRDDVSLTPLSDVIRRVRGIDTSVVMVTVPIATVSPDPAFLNYAAYLNDWPGDSISTSNLLSVPEGPAHLHTKVEEVQNLICAVEAIGPRSQVRGTLKPKVDSTPTLSPISEFSTTGTSEHTFTPSAKTWTTTTVSELGPCRIDLMLIVDSSYSISPSDYLALKEFLVEHIGHFDVENDTVRISVIQYAGTSNVTWMMSDHIADMPGMLRDIQGMEKIQGITSTYTAIIKALDIELKEEDSGRRQDVPLVIMLITDGRTKDDYKFEEMQRKLALVSNKAARAGHSFRIVTMGVGSVDRHELDKIATKDKNVFVVHRMHELQHIGEVVLESACSPEPVPPLVVLEEPECSYMPPTDVLFILDGSKMLTGPNPISHYREMLSQIVNKLKIGPRDTQVGVNFYDDALHGTFPLGFPLNAYRDEKDLQDAISKLEYSDRLKMRGAPYIQQALNEKFLPSAGGRAEARKVAVVVVTSLDVPSFHSNIPSVDDVITAAVIGGRDIIVMAVPPLPGRVGIQEELIGSVGTAISPSKVIWVPESFAEMSDHVDTLRELICGTPPTTQLRAAVTSLPTQATTFPSSMLTTSAFKSCDVEQNDLILLVDGSMDISLKLQSDYSPVKTFISRLASKFVIAENKTLMSVITYDNAIYTTSSHFVAADQYHGNLADLQQVINFMSFPGNKLRNAGRAILDFTAAYEGKLIPGLRGGRTRKTSLVILLDVDEIEHLRSLEEGLVELSMHSLNAYIIIIRSGSSDDHSESVNGVNGYNGQGVNGHEGRLNGLNGRGHKSINGHSSSHSTSHDDIIPPDPNLARLMKVFSDHPSLDYIIVEGDYHTLAEDDISDRLRTLVCEDEPAFPHISSTTIPHTVTKSISDISCQASDVIFVVDSSLLTSSNSANEVTKFMQSIVGLVGVTSNEENYTRFGALTFGENPELHFNLTTHQTTAEVEQALEGTVHYGNISPGNVGKALWFAFEEIAANPRSSGQYVHRQILLLMGRSSDDDLLSAVNTARSEDIDIITFMIGDLHIENSADISTVPHGNIDVQGVNDLERLRYEILELICTVYPAQTTLVPPTTTTPRVPSVPCKVDVIFMIDDILTSNEKSIYSVKKYLNVIASNLVFGGDHFKVGISRLGSSSNSVFPGLIDSRDEFDEEIQHHLIVSPSTGPVSMMQGATEAEKIFNSYGRKSEADSKQMIVFLLSRSPDQYIPTSQMNDLDSKDIVVVSVVMDEAANAPKNLLTNRDGYVNAYQSRYLSYFALPVVYMMWDSQCSGIYRALPTTQRPVPTTVASTTSNIISHTRPTASAEQPTQLPIDISCQASDVIFVVDSSLLTSSNSANEVTKFMQSIVGLVGVTSNEENYTRFGALTFGENPELHFNLTTHQTTAEVEQALEGTVHDGNISPGNIGKALWFAFEEIAANPRSSGQYVHRQILLLMGRSSDDDLLSAVNTARSEDIDIITFMIGDLHIENSADISTVPHGNIDVQEVNDLERLRYEILELICTVYPAQTTLVPPTTTTPRVPSVPCKVDVIYMIDDILTSNEKSIYSVKKYLNVIASNLVFGGDHFKVGISRLGSSSNSVFPGLIDSRDEFDEEIQHHLIVSPSTGPVSMMQGATEAEKIFNSYGRKSEADSKQMIVFLLSRSPDQYIPTSQMNDLDSKDIVVVSVVMDEAANAPKNLLTNRDGYVNAYQSRYLSYFALPVVYMMWDSQCSGIYRALPTTQRPVPTTVASTTSNIISHTRPTASAEQPTQLPIDISCQASDVIFVVDSSLLTSSNSANEVTKFMQSIVGLVGVTSNEENYTRFGALTFGENPELHFNLTTHQTTAEVEQALEGTVHDGNISPGNIGKALWFAFEEIAANPRSSGQYVHRQILLLMGRSSDDDLLSAVNTARSEDIDIITFMIGDLHIENSADISTVPHGNIDVQGVNDLERLRYEILELICTVYPAQTTLVPPTTTTPRVPSVPCKVDVIFMIDDILTSNEKSIYSVKKYLNVIASNLVFGGDHFKVGISRLGSSSNSVFPGLIDSRDEFDEEIQHHLIVSPSTGPVSMMQGATEAEKIFNSYGRKSEADSKQMIVFLLSRSPDQYIPTSQMNDLDSKDIVVVSVVMDEAANAPKNLLTNRDGYVNAYQSRYLSYFALPVVYMMWDSQCSGIYRALPTTQRPVPTTVASITSNIISHTRPTASAEQPTQLPIDISCQASDVIFVVDSSLLTSSNSANEVTKFMQSIVGLVGVTSNEENYTRFGALTFGENPELHFNLTTHQTTAEVEQALEGTVHDGNISPGNIGKALWFAFEEIAANPRSSGQYVHRQILLLMGRSSDDDLLSAVNTARSEDIDIITFMIGDLHIENSADISTVPHGNIDVQGVNDLERLRYEILELICTVYPAQTTLVPPTTTTPRVPSVPCKVDVIFMIDDILTSNEKSIYSVKKYLNVIASNLVFGGDHFKVGISRLGSSSNSVFPGLIDSRDEFDEEIQHHLIVSPSTGPVSMMQGATEAEKIFNSYGRKSEADSKQMIVFLLSRSPDQYIPTSQMNDLDSKDIVVVSVVMDEAANAPKNLLTNRDGYVNAYQSRYLSYFALPVVYMMWDSQCSGVYRQLPTTHAFIEKCEYEQDVAVVVDVSGISNSRLNQLKEFLRSTFEKFEFRNGNTQIAFVTFDSKPTTLSRFGNATTFDEVLSQLQTIKASQGSVTNTGSALTELLDNLLTVEAGARNNVPWTVLLITDGRSKDDLAAPLLRLSALDRSHQGGVSMVILGLLSAHLNELESITSHESITYVENYDQLNFPTPLQSVFNHLCALPGITGTTARITTVVPSTIHMGDVCECKWSDFISRDEPSKESLGDLEVWGNVKNGFGGICPEGTEGYEVQCQSDRGHMQSNVICDHRIPLRCLHVQVPYEEGLWCYNYSVSVKCCTSPCEKPTTAQPQVLQRPKCSSRFDFIFVVDRSTASDIYLHHVASFLYDLTIKFHISQQDSRVAVVQYGPDGAQGISEFQHNYLKIAGSLQSLAAASVGSSDVGGALQYIFNNLVSVSRDQNDNGDIVHKVILIVANSNSAGAVEGLMNSLYFDHNFHFLAVGMNGVSGNLLDRLTTYDDKGIFQPSSLRELRNETAQSIVDDVLCSEEEPTYSYDYYGYEYEPSPEEPGPEEPEPEEPGTGGLIPPDDVDVTTQQPASNTSEFTTTPAVETTTKTQCEYYNETSHHSLALNMHQIVYPDAADTCRYYQCKEDGTLALRNKRLLCSQPTKPLCGNGLQPILYFDDNCNCQWDCQCYCNVGGDPGYHTFDGMFLSYPGRPQCSYVLSQSAKSLGMDAHFQVLVKTGLCDPAHPEATSCVVMVTVVLGERSYVLNQNLTVTKDDLPLMIPHVEEQSQVQINVIGRRKIVFLSSDMGLEIKYEPKVHLVTLSLPTYLWDSRTEGMCGNCNHRKTDDLMLRNGMLASNVQEFGYNWTIISDVNHCSESVPKDTCVHDYDPICDIIVDDIFVDCRSLVDHENYFVACTLDTCTKNYTACDSVAAFVEACRHAGVCVNWRNETICPESCPHGQTFHACRGPPYEKTCDSLTFDVHADEQFGRNHRPRLSEGCFVDCLETEVAVDDTCKPIGSCTMCFDDVTRKYVNSSSSWISASAPCSVCTCDANTLKILCTSRSCPPAADPPICGECENRRIKPGSDPCCPEFVCECDYSNCTAIRPDSCPHGQVERRNETLGGCRAVYDCQCNRDLCQPTTITCNSPQISRSIPTTCCDQHECLCSECESTTPVTCPINSSKQQQTDICNCTREWCEPLPMCITSIRGKVVAKRPHQSWRSESNPCLTCHCEPRRVKGETIHREECKRIRRPCAPCMRGYRRERVRNKCCPRCVREICIEENEDSTTYHNIGDVWSLDSDYCHNSTCENTDGVPIIRNISHVCPELVSPDCSFGFTVHCQKTGCCMECVCEPEKICLLNNSLPQTPGSLWSKDKCTDCVCTHEVGDDGFHIAQCNTTICPPCQAGHERMPYSETCCGECMARECYIQTFVSNDTRVLQIGEVYQERCTTYNCVEVKGRYAFTVQTDQHCPIVNQTSCLGRGGVIVYDAHGCCSECQLPHGTCQALEGESKIYSVKGCTTNRPIQLSYCEGQCSSGSHYHEITGEFIKRCSCCSAASYTNTTVEATCVDGSQTTLLFRIITSCTCLESSDCNAWTRLADFESKTSMSRGEPNPPDEQREPSDDVESGPVDAQDQQTNNVAVLASWKASTDYHVRVVEVSSIPSDYEADVFESVQSTLRKFGLEDVKIKLVKVALTENGIDNAFSRGIDAAFSATDQDNQNPISFAEEKDKPAESRGNHTHH